MAQTPQGIMEQRVKPRDLKDKTSKVTLEASSPEDRINRGMFGFKLWNQGNGAVSELLLRKDFLGQTNALEDMRQTDAERIFRMPEFQAMKASLAAAAAAALLQQQQQTAESTGIQSQGNRFMGPADAAAATTMFPDQAGRVAQTQGIQMGNPIRPMGMGGVDNLAQIGKPGGGPLGITAGRTIQPGGMVS